MPDAPCEGMTAGGTRDPLPQVRAFMETIQTPAPARLPEQNSPETRTNAGSTSIFLYLFHRLLLLAFGVLFFFRFAFVVLLLALGEVDFEFDASAFVMQV